MGDERHDLSDATQATTLPHTSLTCVVDVADNRPA